MTGRTRTTTMQPIQGGWISRKLDGFVYSSPGSYSGGYSTCIDNILPGDGQNFEVLHFRKYAPSVSIEGSHWWKAMSNWNPTHFLTAAANTGSVTGQATIDHIAVKAMAGTNPSKPVVDVPIMIFELPEILQLIKTKGQKIFTDASVAETSAQANLLFQFGIKPLVNDLKSLLEFSEHVDKRVKVMKELQKKGGLSRKYRKNNPFYASGSNTVTAFIHTYGPDLTSKQTDVTEEESWACVKWEPLPGIPWPKDGEALRALCSKAVLGLTIDASTIWEAIPFSWLVDYFIGVGSFLGAYRNMVPARCTQLYVCRHRINTRTWSPTVDRGLVVSSFSTVTETKTRTKVAFVTPAAHFGFLTGTQMSIIASLGVLKR